MKRTAFALLLTTTCAGTAVAADRAAVVETYADIGQATYEDSFTRAVALQKAVEALIAAPSEETLQATRAAWTEARAYYQQSEVFRFGNPVVDDWEGKVNAWPLDEGLIDYVDVSYGESEENPLAAANVIANPKLEVAGQEIDASEITPELIAGTLHEADGVDANVASGYHAIEFLLWGQDLNGTGPGAGARPHTDYLQGEGCTGGNCDRRAAYLRAATDLLVSDLSYMAGAWAPGGEARGVVTASPEAGLLAMLTGLGSLSYGELAGERMKLGLLLNDPEEEQDCFSDNTYNSHYYDGIGMRNVVTGQYTRVDGTEIAGPSLLDLLKEADGTLAGQLEGQIDGTVAALGAIKAAAEAGMAYDQMLAPGNKEGEALIGGGIEALVAQTASIERAVGALGLTAVAFEGSDSLDNPGAVFQ
ncbi:imelysin family protein [Frigidibacter sp. SD6-1]|uniref:imelysin family protein n=1 Tax=Frigidibacter sp. SD6-1 TaxID=3032581 RepID=UPI0024E04015|nr:imelysin family protein [Frigidibacter sp. SD6-1]